MAYPDEFPGLPIDLGGDTKSSTGKPRGGTVGFHSGLHNDISKAINGIAAALGLHPEGDRENVADRLNALAGAIEAGLGESPELLATKKQLDDKTLGGLADVDAAKPQPGDAIAWDGASYQAVGNLLNVKLFGAKGDDAADDTAALVAALSAAEELRTGLFFPKGVYLADLGTLVLKSGGVSIVGGGKLGTTRLKARGGTGYLLTLGKEAGKPFVNENHACGNRVCDIALDGNGRTLDGGGLHCEFQQWLHLSNIYSANFKREAFLFAESVRESTFVDLYARFSGSPSYAQVRFKDEGASDGANNISVHGLRSVYHAGHGLQIQGKSTGLPTRNLYFYGTMLHGPAFPTPFESPEGYVYENLAEFRQGGHNLLVEDARSVRFEGLRLHAPGRGFAHARISQGPAGASTVNEVKIATPSFGTPNEWAELPVTASAGTDTLIATGESLYLGTGAIVRVTSSGELPTGLVASTDYWVIRSSDTAVKLASSRANALAGTAIDLTSAGSGTIKIVPRHEYLTLESGTAFLPDRGANDATKDGLGGFVNRSGSVPNLRGQDAVGMLRTYAVAADGSAPNGPIQALVDGDSAPRFAVTSQGEIFWGPGNEAAERAFYRPSKGVVRTDQILTANGAVNIGGTIAHSGTKVGFFGKAAAGRPNVKAPSEVTPKELCEALEALGLIE